MEAAHAGAPLVALPHKRRQASPSLRSVKPLGAYQGLCGGRQRSLGKSAIMLILHTTKYTQERPGYCRSPFVVLRGTAGTFGSALAAPLRLRLMILPDGKLIIQ